VRAVTNPACVLLPCASCFCGVHCSRPM
jgi:hypothetical protein